MGFSLVKIRILTLEKNVEYSKTLARFSLKLNFSTSERKFLKFKFHKMIDNFSNEHLLHYSDKI